VQPCGLMQASRNWHVYKRGKSDGV